MPKIVVNDKFANIYEFANDEVLNHTKEYFFKKYTKNPFFYFSGTHHISQLDVFSKSNKHTALIKNNNIDFFFFEPLTHYVQGIKINYKPHVLKSNNSLYETENLRCYELDSISSWVEREGIRNITVYCTDYGSEIHYKKIYKNINLKFLDVYAITIANHEASLIKQQEKIFGELKYKKFESSNITKKIIAPAWRYDPSRHFIISFMAERGLLDNNNVSFLYNINSKDLINNMWFNWHEFEFKYPHFGKILLDGNELLKPRLPLTIDVTNPTTITDKNYAIPTGTNIVNSHNVSDRYAESFLSIVMESRATQPWPNISEKTFNAISNLRPFVLVAAPNTLKMLKDMGFKTFNDFWDESYDDVLLNDERLVKICKTIENIACMSINEMRDMHTKMSRILLHNKNQIKEINKFYKKFM